jgi:hypothetical protein
MKRNLLILFLALPLTAQGPKLTFNLDHLAGKAAEKVSITLDGSLLKLAGPFLEDDKAKKLVEGLSAIYLRSFEFDKENAFSSKDYEGIQKQLEAPGWSCFISVRNKRDGEHADICLFQKDGKIGGLALVAVEPKQLTVINIIGSIRPEQLKDLKSFGVPQIEGLDKEFDKKELDKKDKDSKKPPAKKNEEDESASSA